MASGAFLVRLFALILTLWPAQALAQSAAPSEPWPAVPPRRILASPDWSDPRIYPLAARAADAEGVVRSETLVGSDGVPRACRIVTSSGNAALDEGTCALVMSMRFEPAIGADGEAIQSLYPHAIRWSLSRKRVFASGSVTALVILHENGSQGCKVLNVQGPYSGSWAGNACIAFFDRPHFFASDAVPGKRYAIAMRLDAGDQDAALAPPWPNGKMIAQQKVGFTVSKRGRPENCTPTMATGFGPRSYNNPSPCGSLVAGLWLKDARGRPGVVETRVYILEQGN